MVIFTPFILTMIISMSQGTLYIVSAPSGAGKSSLISALLKDNLRYDMKVSVSHTTRPARAGEQDGTHYHFVDIAEFTRLQTENVFLEHAEIFGNFYGTSRLWIEDMLATGTDIFLDIDWQGAQQIRRQLPMAKSIFILPPNREELERRLHTRAQDTKDVISKRMAEAYSEISHFNEYDYVIINDDFDVALNDIKAIVIAERMKQDKQASKYRDMLDRLLTQ